MKKRIIILTLIVSLLMSFANPSISEAKKKIKLNTTRLTLYVGQSKRLKVKNTKKKIKWVSTNKKIASVKKGKVFGRAKGKVTIKVIVSNKTLKCKVVVKRKISKKPVTIPTIKPVTTPTIKPITTLRPTPEPTSTTHIHNWTDGSITKEPTCTEDGILLSFCTECGEKKQSTLEAFGHKYINYVSNGDCSCESDGTKTAYCENGCGKSDTVIDEGSATGHIPDDFVIENKTEYTAEKNGSEEHVCYCKNCNIELSREKVVTEKSVINSLKDYSWSDLSSISKEIGDANCEEEAIKVAQKYHLIAPDGVLTGNETKTVTLTNGQIAEVQILGFSHDTKADGSGVAGISFIFKDCIAKRKIESGSLGWDKTNIYSWLNTTLFDYLPTELQNVIIPVNKETNNTGWTTDINAVTITSDKLWMLSCAELCGKWNNYSEMKLTNPRIYLSEHYGYDECENADAIVCAEGRQYQLFSDNQINDGMTMNKVWVESNPIEGIDEGYWKYEYESTKQSFIIKKYDGAECTWLLRTPGPLQENSYSYYFTVSPKRSLYLGNIGAGWADSEPPATENMKYKGIAPCFSI